jgi:hypothetical protein
MNITEILAALTAYLSGEGSFRLGARTITLANTGHSPVKFTFAQALASAEAAAVLEASGATVYPQTLVIGSTSITVS